MILEVCWDNIWTLSFGLSQFQGRGSWLVGEVALSPPIMLTIKPRINTLKFVNINLLI